MIIRQDCSSMVDILSIYKTLKRTINKKDFIPLDELWKMAFFVGGNLIKIYSNDFYFESSDYIGRSEKEKALTKKFGFTKNEINKISEPLHNEPEIIISDIDENTVQIIEKWKPGCEHCEYWYIELPEPIEL